MVCEELLHAAERCTKKAEEVEAVNREAGFAHLSPEILREKATAFSEFAALLKGELEQLKAKR